MLEKRSNQWRLSLVYTTAILAVFLILFLTLVWIIQHFATQSLEKFARSQIAITAADPSLIDAWQVGDVAAVQALLERWSQATSGQVEAFTPDGEVFAATGSDPTLAASGGNSLEVRMAITHGFGQTVRNVEPGNQRTLFLALPVGPADEPIGVLRWAVPFGIVGAELRSLELAVGAILFLAALALIALMLVLRRRDAEARRRLAELVESALTQDFDGHILESSTADFQRLTVATNRLVDKYRKASKRRARERDRLNTILTHISNGALILSEAGRVRLINPAAAEILRTTQEKALRNSFVQVVWDHRIAAVWQRCQSSGLEETEAIDLGEDRFIRTTVTPVPGRRRSRLSRDPARPVGGAPPREGAA